MLVLITRPKRQSHFLANKLREFGFDVLFEPLVCIEPIADSQTLQSLRTIVNVMFGKTMTSEDGLRYHWLVFSSPNGVNTFHELCGQFIPASDVSLLNSNIKIAVVGPGTANEFNEHWQQPSVTVFSQSGNAEEMVERMTTQFDVKNKRVLILRGDKGRKVIADTLTSCGAIVEEHAIYRTTEVQDIAPETRDKLRTGEIGFVTVTSSSIADALVKHFGDDLHRTNLVSISPLTSQRLTEQGFPPSVEAKEATIDSVLECITHTSVS
ncbi:MAG: uroporphyrinogen-III synthase [Planctomycetaceae bacterium]|nr:uroporphyrinogen-III synthase [Planctomycetaceae bacterium]